MGRDAVHPRVPFVHGVSTHTPLWGVTNYWSNGIGLVIVSTHTPLWGVTTSREGSHRSRMFQPTRPYGA